MQLEKVQCECKGRAAGGFGLLSRFLLVLFAATMPLGRPAAVLAQQPVQTDERNQAAAATAKARTETVTSQPGAGPPTDTKAIRPFRVNVPQEALDDLRRRIAATRWPERETVADSSQGVPLATIRELASGTPCE